MTKNTKILAVDDDPLNLDIIRFYLEKEGFEVIAANDGKEALATIQKHPDVRVIVLDRMMPRMDGMEVLNIFKKNAALEHIPVIMQTAASASEQAWDGISAGVYYYLTKPYEGALLVSIVRSALQDSAHINEIREKQEALLESEELFRTLANNISQMVWMADEAGRVFWFNQRWLDYTGMSQAEMTGNGWHKAHHRDHLERIITGLERSFRTGENWEDTVPLRSKDMEYCWFLARAVPVRDEQGKVLGWFGTYVDFSGMRPYNASEKAIRFTPREKEVLTWQSRGKTCWEIATILNISEDTTKEHIEKARQKLGAGNTAQAIAKALICGIITP